MNKNYLTMRDLPESQRPYEKCMSLGPEALSDAELLAVILRNGCAEESALHLALKVLSKFNSSHTLNDITSASIEELESIKGIGKVKAITLKCVGELSLRLCREQTVSQVTLSDSGSIAAYYMEKMRHLKQEEIWLAMFDTRNNLIKDSLLTRGTINASLITPREVYVKALSHNAIYIVLIHNHPSGDPSPSKEDRAITEKIKNLGELMKIPLADHIVIGDNKYVSMKEKGIL